MRTRHFAVSSIAVYVLSIVGCGGGGSGGGSATPRQEQEIDSNSDIFNPKAYQQTTDSPYNSGIYLFIQSGNYSATVTYLTQENQLIEEQSVERKTRRLVKITGEGDVAKITDYCNGSEYGTIKSPIDFYEESPGIWHAQYNVSQSTVPTVAPAQRLSPLYFGPPQDEVVEITNYSATADFHMVRLGGLTSDIGNATLTYAADGLSNKVSGCILQVKEKSTKQYPQYEKHNKVESKDEWINFATKKGEKIFSHFSQNDAVALGVTNAGIHNTFLISVETSHGDSGYANYDLDRYGQTGEVSYSQSSTTAGILTVGQVIPTENGPYPNDAVEIDFLLDWPLL